MLTENILLLGILIYLTMVVN